MNAQNPAYCIELIRAEETWPLRQEAMWPDKDISFVQLSGDEKALHFGLFVTTAPNRKMLVSCLSVFSSDAALQLRKFATLPSQQQQGWGAARFNDERENQQCQRERERWQQNGPRGE